MKLRAYDPQHRTAVVELTGEEVARIVLREFDVSDVTAALLEGGADLGPDLLNDIAAEVLTCIDALHELGSWKRGKGEVITFGLGPEPHDVPPG